MSRLHRHIARVLTLTLSLLTNCIPDLPLPNKDAALTCEDNADCPNLFSCKDLLDERGQRCIPNDVLAKTPITFVGDPKVLLDTPRVSQQAGSDEIRVRFSLTEQPAELLVTVDSQPFTCTTAGNEFTCTATVTDAIGDNLREVTVVARDAAANIPDHDKVFVDVDRRGPTLRRQSANKTFVRDVVTVDLTFDEQPAALINVKLAGISGEDACAVLVAGQSVSCSIITGSAGEVRHVSGTAVDDLGNSNTFNTADLGEGSVDIITVDTQAPAAPNVAQLVLDRAPWGKDGSDVTTTSLVADDGVDVDDVAQIVVYDRVGGRVIGRSGAFPVELGAQDHAAAVVQVIDAAGNESPVVALTRQRWSATFGGKDGTRSTPNPHQAFRINARDALTQNRIELSDSRPLAPSNAGRIDVGSTPSWAQEAPQVRVPTPSNDVCLAYDAARDEVVMFDGETWVFAAGRWTQRQPPTSPPSRASAACAYDPLRDRTVMMGGVNQSGERFNDVWEWNGSNWADSGVQLTDSLRDGAAAFDDVRLGVVVVGGETANGAVDSILFVDDGGVRTLTFLTTPPARTGASLTSTADGLLLVGGIAGETWRLTDTWTLLDNATQPNAKAIVFLDADDVPTMLLDGGNANDTHRLVNDVWVPSTLLPIGVTLNGHAVVSTKTAPVLFGGTTSARVLTDDEWLLVDTSTLSLPTANTTRLAFDPVLNTVIAIVGSSAPFQIFREGSGGAPTTTNVNGVLVSNNVRRPCLLGNDGAVFEFNGTDFQRVAGITATVTGGIDAAAFVGDDIIAVNEDDTWRLTGTAWTLLSLPNPAAFSDAINDEVFYLAAVSDNAFAVVGDHVAMLDGDEWTVTSPSTDPEARSPEARSLGAFATDFASGHMLLVGGISADSNDFLGDVWELDPDTLEWTELRGVRPAPRFGHALTYDRARQRTTLVGGRTNITAFDEVWRYNGAASDLPAVGIAIHAAFADAPLEHLVRVDIDVAPANPDTLCWLLGRYHPCPAADAFNASAFVGDLRTLNLAFPSAAPGRDAVATLEDITVTLSFDESIGSP